MPKANSYFPGKPLHPKQVIIETLQKIGDIRAVIPLLRELDRDPEVHQAVIESLLGFGAPIVDILIVELTNPSWVIARNAAKVWKK